jgi:transposase IS66 family protein
MQERCEAHLQRSDLHLAKQKVLSSLHHHWDGLTVFVERPEVAMDNNTAERHLRTPYAITGWVPEFEVLLEPGEIGLLPVEEAADGINQDMIGRHGAQTTGLFQRQDAFHPPVALVTGCP